MPPSTGRLSLITEAPLRGEIEWVLKRVELVRGALRCRYRGARRGACTITSAKRAAAIRPRDAGPFETWLSLGFLQVFLQL